MCVVVCGCGCLCFVRLRSPAHLKTCAETSPTHPQISKISADIDSPTVITLNKEGGKTEYLSILLDYKSQTKQHI